MKYAIEIKGLTKSYKGFRAVDNLSIRIPEGKIYGFLGRNGAGKTTTIRMIMGLIKPDEGEILILGKDVKRDRLWVSRNIGGIVETPGFYENLSARENLNITAELYKVDRRQVDEALNIVELTNTGNKKARDFSLGMKQRLGIANALIYSPKILILDEPTNGLDPAGIKDMRNFLRNLSEKQGITVLISSHILSEIQLVADCIGIIDNGRLIEETDVNAIKAADQSYLLLEVDKVKEGEDILNAMKIKYDIGIDGIKVHCSKEVNSEINKNFILKGIKIFNSASIAQTLEERFLSITSEISA